MALNALTGTPIQWVILITLITASFSALGIWLKNAPARRLAENQGDASLRSDLLKRIDKLEATQTTDRANHAEERRKDREECDRVTEELRQRIREQDKLIDGLQRQLIMFQVASGRALPLGANSPEMERMMDMLEPLFGRHEEDSDTLKSAKKTEHAAAVTVEQIQQDEARP